MRYVEVIGFKMIDAVVEFVKTDYESHKMRLAAEGLGFLLSVGVSLLFAWTTPHPPLIWCYSMWMAASSLLVTTSWHRGSFGLTAIYGAFLLIDFVGLWRTVMLS